MAHEIPQDIFDGLEREWRLIEPERLKPVPKPSLFLIPKRLKIARVD